MAERRQPRVLGAKRTVSEVLGGQIIEGEKIQTVIKRVISGTVDERIKLEELESAVNFYANHNSECTRAGVDDTQVLTAEILNNSIRSVMLFGDFSSDFTDLDVYSISVAMQYNLSLEAFTMNGVNVSDEAVSMLCEAFIKSRVSFIDFSNTPLEDEAGRSLAALAHVNPYVRTVVLDDTLIAEEVLDEIDVACQFNQSNFEGNGGKIDFGNSSELARLRHRLQFIIRTKYNKTYFCVAHLLGMCPNGDLCLYSHSPMTSGAPDANANLHERLADLFNSGGNWQEKIPQPPKAGASWRDPDENDGRTLKLNLNKGKAAIRAAEGRRKGEGSVKLNSDKTSFFENASVWYVPVSVVCASMAMISAFVWTMKRWRG